jgi:RNA polymerase sigma-70 factor (ECF subfamily)
LRIDDDKILAIALRERNEKAFEMVIQKYFKQIYHFVRQNCKQVEDAEDLTQDIFVKLWENSQTVEIESLQAYLYTIAKGVVVDWTRRGVNQMVFEVLEDYYALSVDSTEKQITSEQLLSTIHQIAETMPARRLEVYRMRWIGGLSRQEIAERMGITVTTVDIHLRKALDYLRVAVSRSSFM